MNMMIAPENWIIFHSYVFHIDSTSLTSSNATSLSQQTVFATPVSRLLPRISTRQAPSHIGQNILVTIDRWDVTSRYPEGHFVRVLGKVDSKEEFVVGVCCALSAFCWEGYFRLLA
jgi:exosome complex exonuclease DIS3/RRP44